MSEEVVLARLKYEGGSRGPWVVPDDPDDLPAIYEVAVFHRGPAPESEGRCSCKGWLRIPVAEARRRDICPRCEGDQTDRDGSWGHAFAPACFACTGTGKFPEMHMLPKYVLACPLHGESEEAEDGRGRPAHETIIEGLREANLKLRAQVAALKARLPDPAPAEDGRQQDDEGEPNA